MHDHYAYSPSAIATGLLVVKNLQLGKKENIALVFVFSLGFFTVVVSCIRFAFQIKLINEYAAVKVLSGAINLQVIYLASISEIAGGMIAVSLPSLRVWYRKIGETKSSTNQLSLTYEKRSGKGLGGSTTNLRTATSGFEMELESC